MQRDLRTSALYQEAEALYRRLRAPGTGQISDLAEAHVTADGSLAAFAGAIIDELHGPALTRICLARLDGSEVRVVTFGPNKDRLPRFSPDAREVAFLSDRHSAGDLQLHLLDVATGATRAAPRVEGWVEYLHWSPDGTRILLGVAGHGADIAGGQGAVTSEQERRPLASWMPAVETGDEQYRWRSAWIYELATGRTYRASAPHLNVWEVTWCGSDALGAVVSRGPGEGLWYTATLNRLDLKSGADHELYRPKDQLGWPAAAPSGRHIAIVEALASDRWIVAGDLLLFDTTSGQGRHVDTHGVDITYTEWRSDQHLLLAGHRGFESVVGIYDVASREFRVTWSSVEVTTSGRFVSISGFGNSGDCVLVGEGYMRAPELAMIRNGQYQPVRSFDIAYASEVAAVIDAATSVAWRASDGLEVLGWLLRPKGSKPHPLVLCIHGGPVWHWRPSWLGRTGPLSPALMLLRRGYALFCPNPRGSAGRGQPFARRVLRDMGGADAGDLLSGVDHLVAEDLVDPTRMGLMGQSYGGFMTSWLITQDSRFAAAIAIAPITNQVSEHLISNVPQFVSLFLADDYTNPGGLYFQRSPVMHAGKARTPVLNICGALDRCTPPEEAVQFHNALLQQGVESVLVTYPEEGHGIHKWPAVIDYVARVVAWFDGHMPSHQEGRQ
jgi:dipeptidyl aminopeptidase/acylaminoacyl peptidase